MSIRRVFPLPRSAWPVLTSLFMLACGDSGDAPNGSVGGATTSSGGGATSAGAETTTQGNASGVTTTGVAGATTSSSGVGGAGATSGSGGDTSTVGAGGGVAGNDTGASGASAGSGGSSNLPPASWPLLNGLQWADSDGDPIQAHGGGLLEVGGDYYWFGENRNPDGTFYAVSAYRSADLVRWQHVGDVLTMNSDPGLSPANVERPKVVYNEATGRFVMWMHWENGMDYGEARAAVASSDSVDGPYTYHGSFRPYQDEGVVDHDKPGYMSRDCTLFVDDDGQGYFLSTTNENFDLNLYLLSDDYLEIDTLAAVLFEGEHREAPALFKRGDVYFLVTSGSTGWDPNQAQYATSTSLSSGWSSLQNVADSNTFYSQSTYVLPIQGSAGSSYLYMGDRWARGWGEQVNASSYVWVPIEFPSDTSMSMTWSNVLTLDAERGSASGSVEAFVLINTNSGMALSVEGAADQNSADVIQQSPDSANAAAWRFEYDGAGYFRVVNDDGGKVLDVPDESEEPGVAVHLWDDNDGDHQAWRPIDLGGGEYRIVNKNSGLYLGVAAASTDENASVEQQASGGDEQVWQIAIAP